MAVKRDPQISIAPAYQRMQRKMRRPKHTFSLRVRPFQLQPFMLAPVLPGETMKNMLCQARVVSDPLATTIKLQGWWCEVFFFYVKLRDFHEPARTTVTNMMLDPATDVSSLRAGAASVGLYTFNGAIDWMTNCLKPIVEHYFRDEGENWDTALIDGIPQVQVFGQGVNNWSDSLTLNANKRSAAARGDVAAGTIAEISDQLMHWQAIRDAGLTDMDFEDFVKSYGGQVRQDEASPELHRPELVRYTRQYSYPTNTVEPTTGVPTAAAVWSIAERADKDRRFDEPGFIVGLVCARPKVFFANQEGAIAGGMDSVYQWLPAILHDHYEESFKQFLAATGPLPAIISDSYWIDPRDIFLHGDQFLNFASATTEAGLFDLPTATAGNRYASTVDIDQLFSTAANKIVIDGVVDLGILGRQYEATPTRTL